MTRRRALARAGGRRLLEDLALAVAGPVVAWGLWALVCLLGKPEREGREMNGAESLARTLTGAGVEVFTQCEKGRATASTSEVSGASCCLW